MHCGIDPSSVNNNTVKMTDVEHESQIPRPKNSTESSKETFPNKDSKITPPEQWVDLYGDYLYRYALSRLKNPDQASDCVQDTFLAGIKSLEKFDGRMDIKFWLRGIMRNKIVDQIRKSIRSQMVDIEKEDEALMESFWFKYSGIATTNPDPWEFNPRKHYDNQEFWIVFQECVENLKSPQKEAFILKMLEDQSTEEICKEMDISPNYLWVLLHRAREQLKLLLTEKWLKRDSH
ncbi:MAG: RNA polymerase subunit sigma-70 [Puniceicoccaceae bacterium]|nr:RNA polymerase subunit sigma-70 [Puniceicoccaceae bacterium]RCL30804.1 MAG: RNA polymerase subunit sigma-70 [Puniceicoccaceae bacterium]